MLNKLIPTGDTMYMTAEQGQRWDTLSLLLYGEEMYADILITANREYAGKIYFDGGERLAVPMVTVSGAPGLPPWKAGA